MHLPSKQGWLLILVIQKSMKDINTNEYNSITPWIASALHQLAWPYLFCLNDLAWRPKFHPQLFTWYILLQPCCAGFRAYLASTTPKNDIREAQITFLHIPAFGGHYCTYCIGPSLQKLFVGGARSNYCLSKEPKSGSLKSYLTKRSSPDITFREPLSIVIIESVITGAVSRNDNNDGFRTSSLDISAAKGSASRR